MMMHAAGSFGLGCSGSQAALHGRSGTFVLHHDASRLVDGGCFRWTIAPGSGTGDTKNDRGYDRKVARHGDLDALTKPSAAATPQWQAAGLWRPREQRRDGLDRVRF